MNETESNKTTVAVTRSSRPPILVPLAILIVFTGLIRIFDLDLKTTAAFYGGEGSWPWDSKFLIQLLYRYGTIPAIGAASIAGVVWIASAFRSELADHRGLAIFLVLVMAVGPGLVVNAVFKEYWGRPRPRDVREFGGEEKFVPVLKPNFGHKAHSFPSGHASMGFYWMCLGIFYWERNRRLGLGFLLFGVAYGSLMGFGRIVQGAHWLSDILWAAGMVYFTSWILYRTLRLGSSYSPKQVASNATQS